MKLAVFDVDGTLVRPNPVEDECFLAAFRAAFDFDRVSADWGAYAESTDTGIINEVCLARRDRPASLHELGRFRRRYTATFVRRHDPGEGGPIDGAPALIERIRTDPGWSMAIATGNFRVLAVHKLRHAGLECLDAPMATADDSMSRGALVRRAIASSRVTYDTEHFDHVVYLGDAPWDLRAARETRVPFLAVGRACGAPADRMISDYRDPDTVIDRMSQAVCW